MSLLDEAKALGEFRGPGCTIAILKGQHPDKVAEIDELMAAVRAKTVQASKAALAMRQAFDIKFSDDVVRRHGHGTCACQPS